MPCNSEHMNQTPKEEYYQRTAKLLLFAYNRLGYLISQKLKNAAKEYYCSIDFTSELCGLLKEVDRNQEKLLFVFKDKESRDLMDWWQEHQEADKEREKRKVEVVANKVWKKKALAKLTHAEKKALGLITD